MLTYRSPPLARPLRPMIRLLRASGASEDAVLPGLGADVAHWLGWLPPDLVEIRLAADAGFALSRVGLRHPVSVFAECAMRRPLRAVAAAYNLLRGDERRMRDSLRGACAVTPMRNYAAWKAARCRPPEQHAGPDLTIRLVVPARAADASRLAETVESLIGQTHRAWQLVLVDRDAGDALPPDPRVSRRAWNEAATALDLMEGADALGFLQAGDRLTGDALAILAAGLASADAPDLVYADEESVLHPRLKPDWSPDLALATGYLGAPSLMSRALVERLGAGPVGGPDGLDLELTALSAARSVRHVARVLCQRPDRHEGPERRRGALDRHLRATGSPARPRIVDGVLDLHWPLPEQPPLVSVIIPSRDRLDLIGRVSDGVLRGTDYAPLELIIVDNGSTDRAVLDLYDALGADARVRVVPYPSPFNFSEMINAGARAARGSVLLMLNNDIAIMHRDWLGALVAQACRPEIGAVGAKLLYADGTLQHAGVVVGLGGRAGHILRRRPGDTPGHLDRMRVAHEVSAVPAACLAVARCKFDAVGGLDAERFPVDFNDVDVCLRLTEAGWKTIWTPNAVLSHLESTSRGPAVGEKRARFELEAARFSERWRDVIRHDPYYHPALSLTTFGEDLE